MQNTAYYIEEILKIVKDWEVIKNRIISPSIYAADFMNLEREIFKIQEAGGDWIHIDVMDGHFVASVNFGQKMVAQIKSCTKLPLDVHLMVDNPSDHLDSFISVGADYLTFHYESDENCISILQEIRKKGGKAGLSISPPTPVQSLYPVLKYCDLVLVMTINPGTIGQVLDKDCLSKVVELRKYRQAHNLNFLISVDGGVNKETSKVIRNANPDIVIIGSAFFQSEDPAEVIRFLES